MKTSSDPRHLVRRKKVQKLFEWEFKKNKYSDSLIRDIIPTIPTIDDIIEKAAPEWPITQISKADLTILRLAIFELLYEKKNPKKVVIDEAIELAKEFGGETSPSFINGVLGTVVSENTK